MYKFNDFSKIYESNRFKEYEKILFKNFVDFIKDKWDIDKDVKVTLKKSNNRGLYGSVTLSEASVKRTNFILYLNSDSTYLNIFKSLLHELTHVKQISEGRLRASKDWKYVLFNDDYKISVKDYKKILKKGFSEDYKNLPWEEEAYLNMDKEYLIKEYLNSDYVNKIRKENPTIDFIVDNVF